MLGSAGHSVEQRYFMGWSPPIPDYEESGAIKFLLSDDSFRSAIDAVDAVIVNGEGTIHHGNGLQFLAALGAAQHLGKATLLINAVWEEMPHYAKTLRKLDDFTVRDLRSLKYARSLDLPARLVLDSSFGAQLIDQPLQDLQGMTAISDWHHTREKDVGSAVRSLIRNDPQHKFYLPLERGDAEAMWARFPATIATCDTFVTGRHHGICLAIAAHRPFVPLPSNTHKVEGLLEVFDARVPIATSIETLREAIEFSLRNTSIYDDIAKRLSDLLPLDTFRILGTSYDPDGAKRELEHLNRDKAAYLGSVANGEWMTRELSRLFMSSHLFPPTSSDANSRRLGSPSPPPSLT